MTTYSTATVEKFLADNNLRTVMVLHDDFTRHETYVVAQHIDDPEMFKAIIYVAPDDHLSHHDTRDGSEAVAYIMSTAFATFASRVAPDEHDTTAMLMTARNMRSMALNHVKHNMKAGCTNWISQELYDEL